MLAVLVVGAGACGTAPQETAHASASRTPWEPGLTLPPVSGRQVPITARAIAAVMLSVLPGNTVHRSGSTTSDAIGAELAYRDFPGAPALETDAKPGDLDYPDAPVVDVAVVRRASGWCTSGVHCEALEPVDGMRVTMSWFTKASEGGQGPGQLVVWATHRDGSVVSVTSSFDDITGDPRRQHLTIPIARMRELVTEPRLGRTTDAALVEAGRRLPGWQD